MLRCVLCVVCSVVSVCVVCLLFVFRCAMFVLMYEVCVLVWFGVRCVHEIGGVCDLVVFWYGVFCFDWFVLLCLIWVDVI